MTLEEIIATLQMMMNREQDKVKEWCLFVAISTLKRELEPERKGDCETCDYYDEPVCDVCSQNNDLYTRDYYKPYTPRKESK